MPVFSVRCLSWYGHLACFLGQIPMIQALAIFFTTCCCKSSSFCLKNSVTLASSLILQLTILVSAESGSKSASRADDGPARAGAYLPIARSERDFGDLLLAGMRLVEVVRLIRFFLTLSKAILDVEATPISSEASASMAAFLCALEPIEV